MIEPTFPQRLHRRHLLIAVLIMVLAFGLRGSLAVQRAFVDEGFIPEAGRDHYTYLTTAQLLLTGDWPTGAYYYHPAPTYFFAAVYTLVGDDLMVVTLVIGLLDTLTCGLLIGAGWLLSKRPLGGYSAGLLYAVYPVAIFYGTVPLIVTQATFLLTLFVFITLWQRENLNLGRTVLLGIVAGAIIVSRMNLIPILGLYGLWLWMLHPGWKRFFTHGTLFALFMVATVAPFTWNNYHFTGQFIPVATTGSQELYMANNRDSAGRHGKTPAHLALDRSYRDALLHDIQVVPEHFIGLLAYKWAVFWSYLESGNNVSFRYTSSVTFLRWIPLNFVWLAVPGVVGLVALLRKDRQAGFLLGGMLLWMNFAFLIIFLFARLRFPAVIPLILGTGYLLATLYDDIIYSQKKAQEILRFYAPGILLTMCIALCSWWILRPDAIIPPKRTYDQLPEDARIIQADFGDIVLVGYRPFADWPAAAQGWLRQREAYTVELFWQVPAPTEIDNLFYLAYVDDETRYAAVDLPLGSVSFPAYETHRWQPGTIYGEIVSIRLDADIPQERSGQIRVGVWYWDQDGKIVNRQTANDEPYINLQTLAVFKSAQTNQDFPENSIIFGDQIALTGYTIPQHAQAGETLPLAFEWSAVRDVDQDYTLFLHLVNEEETIVAQGDSAPVPQLFTSNWMPDYALSSQLTLTMPETPGTYRLYGGLYDAVGRLSVDAPDDRVLLAEIEVE